MLPRRKTPQMCHVQTAMLSRMRRIRPQYRQSMPRMPRIRKRSEKMTNFPPIYTMIFLFIMIGFYIAPNPFPDLITSNQKLGIGCLVGCLVNVYIVEAWASKRRYHAKANRAIPSIVLLITMSSLSIYGIIKNNDAIVVFAAAGILNTPIVRRVL